MRLVVDSNVVISALITDSAVRAALRTSTDDLFTPWYVDVELKEHRTDIRRKSGLSSQAYDALIQALMRYIEVVPREATVPHLHTAARAIHASDPDDTVYVAAALAVGGTVVGNDQAFENQRAVPHMWTSRFVERALGPNDEDGSEE